MLREPDHSYVAVICRVTGSTSIRAKLTSQWPEEQGQNVRLPWNRNSHDYKISFPFFLTEVQLKGIVLSGWAYSAARHALTRLHRSAGWQRRVRGDPHCALVNAGS